MEPDSACGCGQNGLKPWFQVSVFSVAMSSTRLLKAFARQSWTPYLQAVHNGVGVRLCMFRAFFCPVAKSLATFQRHYGGFSKVSFISLRCSDEFTRHVMSPTSAIPTLERILSEAAMLRFRNSFRVRPASGATQWQALVKTGDACIR